MARIRKHASLRFNLLPWLVIAAVIGGIVWIFWAQKNFVYTSNVTFISSYLPKQYEGFKVAHVTNLDNGDNNAIKALEKADPDLIVVSGGIAGPDGQFNKAVKQINAMGSIAPTYYLMQYEDLAYKDEIIGALSNAAYLEDASVVIEAPGITAEEYIKKFMGVDIEKNIAEGKEDSAAYLAYIDEQLKEDASRQAGLIGLEAIDMDQYEAKDETYNLIEDAQSFNMMMLGDLTKFDEISITGINLVFCGGTYGIDNETGYRKGNYSNNSASLFVSGGVVEDIPNKSRFFNFPEVQIVTLSDGSIARKNPLEKVLDKIIGDTGTIFDNDGGFKEHKYQYGGLDGENNLEIKDNLN